MVQCIPAVLTSSLTRNVLPHLAVDFAVSAGEQALGAFAAVIVFVFQAFAAILARLIFLARSREALTGKNRLHKLVVQSAEVVDLLGGKWG